jgi:hypothetical protein
MRPSRAECRGLSARGAVHVREEPLTRWSLRRACALVRLCAPRANRQMVCAQQCSGLNLTMCPPGMAQFVPPADGLSGYTGFYGTHVDGGDDGFPYSLVDKVVVPDVEEGHYLLSWRWDCEQSHQIWQNCVRNPPPPPLPLPPEQPNRVSRSRLLHRRTCGS